MTTNNLQLTTNTFARLAALCFVVAVVVSTGCGALDAMDFQGEYTLVTVNGAKLPASVPVDGSMRLVQSGTAVLNYDGSVGVVLTVREADGTSVKLESAGTFEVIPSGKPVGRFEKAPPLRIDLKWKGQGTTIAYLDGQTLTLDRGGAKYAYRFAAPATK